MQTTGKKAVNVRETVQANRRITSETLFNKLRELIIQHEGKEYRLRITANNKLILTK